jgi:hypothetical protein
MASIVASEDDPATSPRTRSLSRIFATAAPLTGRLPLRDGPQSNSDRSLPCAFCGQLGTDGFAGLTCRSRRTLRLEGLRNLLVRRAGRARRVPHRVPQPDRDGAVRSRAQCGELLPRDLSSRRLERFGRGGGCMRSLVLARRRSRLRIGGSTLRRDARRCCGVGHGARPGEPRRCGLLRLPGPASSHEQRGEERRRKGNEGDSSTSDRCLHHGPSLPSECVSLQSRPN